MANQRVKATRAEPLPRPRREVRWFAGWMEKKLIKNESKGGWSDSGDDYLLRRIADERNELARRLRKLERQIRRGELVTREQDGDEHEA